MEVRPFNEIRSTLDERGELEKLPFMPEMLAYCGRRFEVWKRAHKTCDEAAGGALRSLRSTVHLKEARCNGTAHAGCDAGCLLFWKEQWLKRVEPVTRGCGPGSGTGSELPDPSTRRMLETIGRATRYQKTGAPEGQELFSCQATEVSRFSQPLPWWDLRQYGRDLCARNVTLVEFFTGLFIGVYNKIQDLLGGTTFGFISGVHVKTPHATLDLSPGDLVRIKSKGEVISTLDGRGKNRGLRFPPAMLPYCGKEHRVLRRVLRVINPHSHEMISLCGPSVILEGVVCTGKVKRFCPRMLYPYWRDVWLTKVAEPENARAPADERAPRPAMVRGIGALEPTPSVARRVAFEPASEEIPSKSSVEPS